VLTRSEYSPDSPLTCGEVEEVFVSSADVLKVFVGGRTIGTTAAHPFWVDGKGWTPAGELVPGNRLVSSDGRLVAVHGVQETGEHVRVYNLRVADRHTYFVGADDWGFDVWAHNTCAALIDELLRAPELAGVTRAELVAIKRLGELGNPRAIRMFGEAEYTRRLEGALREAGLLKNDAFLSPQSIEAAMRGTQFHPNQGSGLERVTYPWQDRAQPNPYPVDQPFYRSLYDRIQALIDEYGIERAEQLRAHFPDQVHVDRFAGLEFHLQRAEFYARNGLLRSIELPIRDAIRGLRGEVDMLLDGNLLVDAKNWTGWNNLADFTRADRMIKLQDQVIKYLNDERGFSLRLEFNEYVPTQIRSMLQELRSQQGYGPRLEWGHVDSSGNYIRVD
jgi:hypothetical protein